MFDEQKLVVEIGSPTRNYAEKSVPGLDGVLSLDLGSRTRKIKQKGVLRAVSRRQLNLRIAAISAFINGKTHELVTNEGERFNDLRMDSFETGAIQLGGAGVGVGYEILYTQLAIDTWGAQDEIDQ